MPECAGESLTKNLLKQIKPFKTNFHFNQRVEKLEKKNNNWLVTTSDQVQFETPNIVIAAGVGSFEPRKPPLKNIEKFEKTNLLYAVKDKTKFKDQTVCIFGGGDSALDWTVETNEKGIFAIGDICTYPGKLKLILSGFHEGALCAQECFKRARPDEKYVFRFTTSSSDIQKRLGVKK